MDQNATNSLANFMKSKFNEKANKNNDKSNNKLDRSEDNEIDDKEARAQRELKKVKRQSQLKAGNYSKFEMYKKLIVQCILGYLAMMAAMIILVLSCIMIGPAVLGFFQMIINEIVLASFQK